MPSTRNDPTDICAMIVNVISAHSLTFMLDLLWLPEDLAATRAIELRLRMRADHQRRAGYVASRERLNRVDHAMLGAQFRNVAKFDGAHRARIHAHRVLPLGQQVFAEVALAHQAGRL